MRRPLRDQHHFRLGHLLSRYSTAPDRLYREHFDNVDAPSDDISLLPRLPRPPEPQNAAPDDLPVRRINRVHSPKISSRNDELPEPERVAREGRGGGVCRGRDGRRVGPCCEPDCKVEEVSREVLQFGALR